MPEIYDNGYEHQCGSDDCSTYSPEQLEEPEASHSDQQEAAESDQLLEAGDPEPYRGPSELSSFESAYFEAEAHQTAESAQQSPEPFSDSHAEPHEHQPESHHRFGQCPQSP